MTTSPAGECLFQSVSRFLARVWVGAVLMISPPIGSTLNGTDRARGEFDEGGAFARSLAQKDVTLDYQAMGGWAGLGPITAEEEAMQREAAAQRLVEVGRESQNRALAMVGSTNCVTNVMVYLANVSCEINTNGSATITFDILGGTTGLLYDIFSTVALAGTNSFWSWLERGPTCYTYQYTNLPNAFAFYQLGTPQDSDGDGLTDAYEQLVSKTNPYDPDTDKDGLPDGWEVANGMNANLNEAAQVGKRKNYTYDTLGWLRQVTGGSVASFSYDKEGNITQATH